MSEQEKETRNPIHHLDFSGQKLKAKFHANFSLRNGTLIRPGVWFDQKALIARLQSKTKRVSVCLRASP